ncbi:MAG: hypothetical protein J0G30_12785 [Actinomycetales bacterium]|nr:hypothetical protein [Actinomycetales bacterium]
MNVFAFVVSAILFLGSFLLFGYAFAVGGGVLAITMFIGGVLAVSASLAIPFHILGRSSSYN